MASRNCRSVGRAVSRQRLLMARTVGSRYSERAVGWMISGSSPGWDEVFEQLSGTELRLTQPLVQSVPGLS